MIDQEGSVGTCEVEAVYFCGARSFTAYLINWIGSVVPPSHETYH